MINALVLAAITPLCSSHDIAATIAATDRAAGHAQTTIALKNTSQRACLLKPYPQLSLVHYSEPEHVPLSRYGPGARTLVVRPGGSAALPFVWSDMGIGAAPCTEVADALLMLPGGGLPLWVPVHVSACLSIHQSPLTAPAPNTQIIADGDTRVAADDRWWETQSCQPRLLHLTLVPQSSKPRFPDALAIDLSRGTNLNVSGHTGQAVNSTEELYDPDEAVFATTGTSKGYLDTTVCARINSIPYAVARGSLDSVRTARGVRFGMSINQVELRDGPANSIPLGAGYSALHYQWRQRSEHFDMTFLFYKSALMAIEYVDNPQ